MEFLRRLALAVIIKKRKKPDIQQMTTKKFKLKANEFIDLVPKMGGCFATDKITVEGMKVGYMYREESEDESDSGWRFFSGTDTQESVDDTENTMYYDVNTIANYDRTIIPYLESPFGSELERIENTEGFNLII